MARPRDRAAVAVVGLAAEARRTLLTPPWGARQRLRTFHFRDGRSGARETTPPCASGSKTQSQKPVLTPAPSRRFCSATDWGRNRVWAHASLLSSRERITAPAPMKEPRRPAREIASFFTDQAQSLAKPNTLDRQNLSEIRGVQSFCRRIVRVTTISARARVTWQRPVMTLEDMRRTTDMPTRVRSIFAFVFPSGSRIVAR